MLIVSKDPHEQSKNEKILSEIIEHHVLIVINGLKDKCSGLITRERYTVQGVEQSVIDIVIVSSDLGKHIEYMHIDDKRIDVLTRLTKTATKQKRVESDHNVIDTKFNVPWNKKPEESIEVFNFKDTISQKNFFTHTERTKDLIKIFDSKKSLEVQTKKFLKRLDGFIHQS